MRYGFILWQILKEKRDCRGRRVHFCRVVRKIIIMARNQNSVIGLVILDLVVMALCFTLAAVLVAPGLEVATIREFMAIRISLGNFILFTAFVALWHLLFSAFGLYEDSLLWNGYLLPCESNWRYRTNG